MKRSDKLKSTLAFIQVCIPHKKEVG